MMENYLDSIVLLNDVNEVEHHPVERPSRYRKLHFHISMQQEDIDTISLHPESPTEITSPSSQTTTLFFSAEYSLFYRYRRDLLLALVHYTSNIKELLI